MTTLAVVDDDGGRLWKRKGEGAGPTWLLSIPILPRMTARPDIAAPAEAEEHGSWADMVCCFQQSMRECIK